MTKTVVLVALGFHNQVIFIEEYLVNLFSAWKAWHEGKLYSCHVCIGSTKTFDALASSEYSVLIGDNIAYVLNGADLYWVFTTVQSKVDKSWKVV